VNQNLTHRQALEATARGDSRPTTQPLVQTFEGTKERLAREILAVSGPMMNPARHQHWLLTLSVDVLKRRLEALVTEKGKA
jgi:hypothetical protein